MRRRSGFASVRKIAVTDASLLAYEPQITAMHLESPIPLPYPEPV
jgi:hypothetical protein